MAWVDLSTKSAAAGTAAGGVKMRPPTVVGTAGAGGKAAAAAAAAAAVPPTETLNSWCVIAFCTDQHGGWCQGRLLLRPAQPAAAAGGGGPAGSSTASTSTAAQPAVAAAHAAAAGKGGRGGGGGLMDEDEDDFASDGTAAPPQQIGLYGEELQLESGHPDRAKFHRCCFADDDEVQFFNIKTIDFTKPDGMQETLLGVVAKSGGDTVKLESQTVEFLTTRYTLGPAAAELAARYFPSLGVQPGLLICEGEVQLETPKPSTVRDGDLAKTAK
eukprot:gene7127-31797_t